MHDLDEPMTIREACNAICEKLDAIAEALSPPRYTISAPGIVVDTLDKDEIVRRIQGALVISKLNGTS